jgi:hypothetical protein
MKTTLPLRLTALLTAAVLAGSFAACGGDDEGGEGSTTTSEFTDEQQIQAAVDVWYGADKTAACGILSDAAIESIGGIDKCLGNAASPAGATKAKVTDLQIDGDTASAQVVVRGMEVPFEFVLEDDQWRVESPTPTIF